MTIAINTQPPNKTQSESWHRYKRHKHVSSTTVCTHWQSVHTDSLYTLTVCIHWQSIHWLYHWTPRQTIHTVVQHHLAHYKRLLASSDYSLLIRRPALDTDYTNISLTIMFQSSIQFQEIISVSSNWRLSTQKWLKWKDSLISTSH